ncbi:MAG: L,D-transpeptidase family protein [Actinomycetaceae bacterium]|nr:L,D-transpeptidase family protein [Actinomycetaceae bacterium]
MSDKSKQIPERVSLFSSAMRVDVSETEVTEKADEQRDTVKVSPYDSPVQVDKTPTATQVLKTLSRTFEPVSDTAPTQAMGAVPHAFPTVEEPRHEEQALQDAQPVGLGGSSEYVESSELSRHEEKRVIDKKKAGIVAGILAALAIVYFAGVFIYSHRFFPRTTFGSLSVANQTFDDAQATIEQSSVNYSLIVAGQGLDFTVTPAESGMEIDACALVEGARAKMNPWGWPVFVFTKHDLANSTDVAVDSSALGDYIADQVAAVNEGRPASENARIDYDTKSATFTITPEVYGEQLDTKKVVSTVSSCIFHHLEYCDITAKEILAPTAHAADKNVVAGAQAANKMLGVNAKITSPVAEEPLATIDSELLAQWVVFDKDFKPSIDQEAVKEWTAEAVKPLSTVGATRTYTRPDGKKVTVSGGTFGCSINTDDAVVAVNKAIKEKETGDITLERTCAGTQAGDGSATEWGAYVDVDLSEQRARYYDASGKVLWQSGIVSGNVSQGNSTPAGVWYLLNKQRNITLRAPRDANDKPKWDDSHVSYWMPFKGNLIGLHDADWRTEDQFSNSSLYRFHGSHGCVNLPVSSAGSLYSMISVGTPVVVHY